MGIDLTPAILQRVYPVASVKLCDTWAEPISAALNRWEINTLDRAAAFLGQCGWECYQLKYMVEEYVAGSRYPERWRGRGLIHLTWPENYLWAGARLGLGTALWRHPDMAALPMYAPDIAGVYWRYFRGGDCNVLVDRGKMRLVTRKINGPSCSHHEQRMRYIARARAALKELF